jgi:hypothetical protein
MGRARGATSAGTRRSPHKSTTKALDSGFDATRFTFPDIDSGDLATVVIDTYAERDYYPANYMDEDDYYSQGDDYYPAIYRSYPHEHKVIADVYVQSESVSDILWAVMRHHRDRPLAAELTRNPYFAYAVARAASSLRGKLRGVSVNWDVEHDYYGDIIKDVEIGSEYLQILNDFKKTLEDMFALSLADDNDTLIEATLLSEYGHLIPRVKNKHFVIKKVKIEEIIRRRTKLAHSEVEVYARDQWYVSTRANTKRMRKFMPSEEGAGTDFVAVMRAQPQLLLDVNARGQYRIIDGHHRFKALCARSPAPKSVLALVAE